MELVKELDYGLTDLSFQIELCALADKESLLRQAVHLLIDHLQIVLGRCLEQQNLVVVVSVVRKVATLFADELLMSYAVGHVRLQVVGADSLLRNHVRVHASQSLVNRILPVTLNIRIHVRVRRRIARNYHGRPGRRAEGIIVIVERVGLPEL